MPNWCNNVVYAEPKVLSKLLGKNNEGKVIIDFNKIMPMPEHQPDMNKPNFFLVDCPLSQEDEGFSRGKNWYVWSIENWGTSRNASTYEDELKEHVEDGEVYFDTAWSPCVPLLIELSKQTSSTIRHMFSEIGQCFFGYIVYKDGEVIASVEGDLEYIPDEDESVDIPTGSRYVEYKITNPEYTGALDITSPDLDQDLFRDFMDVLFNYDISLPEVEKKLKELNKGGENKNAYK